MPDSEKFFYEKESLSITEYITRPLVGQFMYRVKVYIEARSSKNPRV
jgi:hypothetical protein